MLHALSGYPVTSNNEGSQSWQLCAFICFLMSSDISLLVPIRINVSYIHLHIFTIHNFTTNSQPDQLPTCLVALLVEHHTSIKTFMDLNLTIKLKYFFRLYFLNCQICSVILNCIDLLCLSFFLPLFKYNMFLYSRVVMKF